jgi:hypothetical protein
MATHFLGRISWKFANDDPKNVYAINPCFRHQFDPLSLTQPDWQTLANDLRTAIDGWTVSAGATKVQLYQLSAGDSGPPKAISEANPTAYRDTFAPPQAAITFSFYGTNNVKRQRGRLYIPPALTGITSAQVGSQVVPAAIRTKVGALAPIFAGLGGANVDWIVWSRVAQAATKVQNWWVDDSWDVIRSRKLAATARTTGTTGG